MPGNTLRTEIKHPVTSLLVKVHSRCNLMCDYCYEYNSGNTAWRSKPKEMSALVYEKMLERVQEHCLAHEVKDYFFSFHGGEPLLRNADWYRYAVVRAKEILEPYTHISFGTQSNGTLLTEEWVSLLSELSISYGISLDGPRAVHDKFRVHSNGDPSFEETLQGCQHLLTPTGRQIWGGILSVMDVTSDPIEVFDFLASLNPPTIDFLEPHATWDKMPPGKKAHSETIYGDWLVRLFDYWFDNNIGRIPIRKFDEIIEHLCGGEGMVESFGLEPVTLVTVATDGMIETVDCMKAAKSDAHYLGLSVFENSFDEVLMHPLVHERQTGLRALPEKCQNCDLVLTCGGGYFPHRYDSKDDSYKHPTAYCADYQVLISYIKDKVERAIGKSLSNSTIAGSAP